MNNKKLWIKRIICKLFGHKRIVVIEEKPIHTNTGVFGISRKDGKTGYINYVIGSYHVCARCGKTLSEFKRF